MRLVCISDTHGKHHKLDLPDGDLLIHAGDFTSLGELTEVYSFANWLKDQPHEKKIVVAGNHDKCLSRRAGQENLMAKVSLNEEGIYYLEDQSVDIANKKIYGTPWSLQFGNWAFMGSEERLSMAYEKIPDDVDIVVSHGPPYGILDELERPLPGEDPNAGSKSLKKKIDNIRPDIVVFGHVHEAYGEFKDSNAHYINASICNLDLNPNNDPIIVDL